MCVGTLFTHLLSSYLAIKEMELYISCEYCFTHFTNALERRPILSNKHKLRIVLGRLLPEDHYKLDPHISNKDHTFAIFLELSSIETHEARRLNLLNSLVRVIKIAKSSENCGFSTEELLYW